MSLSNKIVNPSEILIPSSDREACLDTKGGITIKNGKTWIKVQHADGLFDSVEVDPKAASQMNVGDQIIACDFDAQAEQDTK
jgi:hypothetical protein